MSPAVQPSMTQRKLFVTLPFSNEFGDVYEAILEAAEKSKTFHNKSLEVVRADELFGQEAAPTIEAAIRDADVVIADTSYGNHNVLFELGIANALAKPAIIINLEC